jgi:hypothetical protein
MNRTHLCLIVLGLSLLRIAAAHAAPACTPSGMKKLVPVGGEITLAREVPESAELPGYCLVEGILPTEKNSLRFRLGLPRKWNGMFLFEGAGGMVGLLVPIDGGLRRGYAVTTTDTGHTGTPVDVAWALNSMPKKLDWAFRAVHVTTVVAKSLVQSYYGKSIRHSFIEGGSNGGRQGLMEAQRYPDDYDGVIAGAPAMAPTVTLLGWIWDQQVLRASPAKLTVEDLALVGKATRAQCDALDDLADQLIEDPRRCEIPFAKLMCDKHTGIQCLSAEKVNALKKLWDKPTLDDGQRLFAEQHGYEDDESVWNWYIGFAGGEPRQAAGLEILRNMFLDDPHRELASFDVQHDGAAVVRQWSSVFDATNPNITPFLRRGAKLLLWQGWADAAIPALYTIDYYQRAMSVSQQLGFVQDFDRSVRLFMVPAMSHGPGIGPWPMPDQLLQAMETWTESGVPPDSIVVQQRDAAGQIARSRPLCAYPLVAHYVGSGSIDKAESFRCQP